jgi:hypothetical protein
LKNYCKADFNRIGVVSIRKTEKFLGIEILEPFFLEFGIPSQNILIRSLDEAMYTRKGDGL